MKRPNVETATRRQRRAAKLKAVAYNVKTGEIVPIESFKDRLKRLTNPGFGLAVGTLSRERASRLK